MDTANNGGCTEREWVDRMIDDIIRETEWGEISKLLPRNSRHKIQIDKLIKQLNRRKQTYGELTGLRPTEEGLMPFKNVLDMKTKGKPSVSKSDSEAKPKMLSDGLDAVAWAIQCAQNDMCRAQRRLWQKGEGVARNEAMSAKARLQAAIDLLTRLGI